MVSPIRRMEHETITALWRHLQRHGGGRRPSHERAPARPRGGYAWLALALFATPSSAIEDCPFEPGPAVVVTRAIDGETVALADGSQVRLINVLPGDSIIQDDGVAVARAAAGGTASAALAGLTGAGRLYFSGARQDRRGRWLAQLFVEADGERVWAQAYLVERGLARVQSPIDARACVRRLLALEARARRDQVGLWRHPDWAVVPASRTRALLDLRNEFAVVEGRVVGVAAVRNWTFLNFGGNWRRDFTVAIAAGDRHTFEGSGIEPMALQGARVRVRGWIESWNGPAIKVTHPEQIEVLTGGEPGPR